MKVVNPRYRRNGMVVCEDYPLHESDRKSLRNTGICGFWQGRDGRVCPTAATYQEACDRADAVAISNGETVDVVDPEEVLP